MGKAQAELLGQLQSGRELMRFSSELEPCSASEEPERWIHILPAGPHVEARDGRKFTVGNAEEIAAASELPMLIDWEHASENGDTRAAGWVDALRVEPASSGSKAGLWGKVKWTPQGREHVSTQHYRFLSPVVLGKRALSAEHKEMRFHVERIRSVALTNRPALKMHGIEQLREQLSHQLGAFAADPQAEDRTTMAMDPKLKSALCSAFGLKPEASDEELVSAATPLIEQARKAASSSERDALSQLTETLNAERQRSATLETELASFRKTSFATEVQSFFEKGSREGKIPPAAQKEWLEFCSEKPEHFETFKTVIYPKLAVIGTPAPTSKPKGKKTTHEAFSEKSPHGVDRQALLSLGYTEAQILESEREVFSARGGVKRPENEGDDDGDDDADDDADGDDDGAAAGGAAQAGG